MYSLGRGVRERTELRIILEQNFHYLREGNFSGKQLWGVRSGAQLRVWDISWKFKWRCQGFGWTQESAVQDRSSGWREQFQYWNSHNLASPGGSDGKESAYNAGDPGSTSGSGKSPGEGNGIPLQYSCLGNPMDRGARRATVHGVGKSWTQLND